MRGFLSGVLTLVAMAAIVVALPSVWMQQRLVDADGFVATISPMAQNAQVQDYLADQIATQVTQQAGLGFTAPLIKPIATAYTHSDQFSADFADLLSQQHAWLFDEPAPGSDTSVMQLDITDMVNRVVQQRFNVTVSGAIMVPLDAGSNGLEAGRYHQVGQQITTIAFGSLIVAVIAGLLALIIARRRGVVMAFLGLGAVLGAVAAWAVALYFADRAKQEVEAAQGPGAAATNVIVDATADDLQHVALITGAVGIGVILVGIVIAAISGARRR